MISMLISQDSSNKGNGHHFSQGKVHHQEFVPIIFKRKTKYSKRFLLQVTISKVYYKMYPKYILRAITNSDVMFWEHVEVVSMLAIIFAPSFHVSKRHRYYRWNQVAPYFQAPHIDHSKTRNPVSIHVALKFTIKAYNELTKTCINLFK